MAQKKLISVAGQHEATVLKSLLEINGIPCRIQGESQMTPMGTEAGFAEISVMVEEADLERAVEVLSAKQVEEAKAAPATGVEGAVCPVHEQAALGTCSRCGTYVCQGCVPTGGEVTPEFVCEDCISRSNVDQRRTRRQRAAWTMLLIYLGGPALLALGAGIVWRLWHATQ